MYHTWILWDTVDGSEIRLTTCDVKISLNNGINCLLTGAGFLPSTVSFLIYHTYCFFSVCFFLLLSSLFFLPSGEWFSLMSIRLSNVHSHDVLLFLG